MRDAHAFLLALPCVHALTLLCGPLLAPRLPRSQLLLAVAAQRLNGQLLACFLLHRREQCRVVRRLVRAVGAEDRGTYMLLHLPLAQHAWSACSLLALQGLRRPIPALVPPLDHSCSALHSEAMSKRVEASTTLTCAVMSEDGVLMLGSVAEHA
jgi:hypothetical protein